MTVRGYDDDGRGVPVAGRDRCALGGAQAPTGADGVATVTVPAARGRRAASTAERAGMVRSFPVRVAVRVKRARRSCSRCSLALALAGCGLGAGDAAPGRGAS